MCWTGGVLPYFCLLIISAFVLDQSISTVCLFVYLSVYVKNFACMLGRLIKVHVSWTGQSLCISVCLSVCVSVCLSVCLCKEQCMCWKGEFLLYVCLSVCLRIVSLFVYVKNSTYLLDR